MNFREYRVEHSKKWHAKFQSIFLTFSMIILLAEIVNYLVFKYIYYMADPEPLYILKRILLPSGINFAAILAARIFLSGNGRLLSEKDFAVSLMCMVICSTTAIFHNYYKVFLVATSLPFLLSSIFANTALLRRLGIITIPVQLLAFFTMWTDRVEIPLPEKILNIFSTVIFVTSTYYFSMKLIQSQKEHISHLYTSFKKQQELISELKVEPMTKLCNRAAMNAAIQNCVDSIQKTKKSPYICVIDLDFFKSVNDTYGHSAGDNVLVKAAQLIAETAGGYRNAFRYGGEEFLIIFGDSDDTAAFEKTESLREKFSATEFDFAPGKNFTLSAGVKKFEDGMSAGDWFNSADELLYKAKESGRNRVLLG